MKINEAKKDIKARMKLAKNYREIWPSEFILIEYLQKKLREEKKFSKKLKRFIESGQDELIESNSK